LERFAVAVLVRASEDTNRIAGDGEGRFGDHAGGYRAVLQCAAIVTTGISMNLIVLKSAP